MAISLTLIYKRIDQLLKNFSDIIRKKQAMELTLIELNFTACAFKDDVRHEIVVSYIPVIVQLKRNVLIIIKIIL